jgi:hypothetical protein
MAKVGKRVHDLTAPESVIRATCWRKEVKAETPVNPIRFDRSLGLLNSK